MIEVDSLQYRAGVFRLEDISFTVGENETLVVLGPTGAGKTVLLELIAGHRRPDSGVIRLNDVDITHLPPEKRNMGLVYQDYLLFPHLNVFDNIAYGMRARRGLKKDQIRRNVEEFADQIGITHLLERRTKKLSGGEQQRVALARTLIVDPEILLLDEPFSAVDPSTKERLMRELSRMLESRDKPVIYVTHDQIEASEMADRIAVMNEGKIVQLDAPSTVFNAPKSRFVADFVGIQNIFKGRANRTNGTTLVDIDGIEIRSSVNVEGDVHVTLRPEDIIVSSRKLESSARNSLRGKVKTISERGPLIFLTADCGIELTASITKEAFRELKVTIDDEIFMTFKAPSVNLF